MPTIPYRERRYRRKIAAMHRELGIPKDYASRRGMVLQLECACLVPVEADVFGRRPLLHPDARRAWRRMKAGARGGGVELQIVSAYRSAEYQFRLFLRKLDAGRSLDEILTVNAAPGYSEHHSGLALDIGCPGYEHLSEAFEDSPAFRWLRAHGGRYGYILSFPRGNPAGVLYEPWHWKYSPKAG